MTVSVTLYCRLQGKVPLLCQPSHLLPAPQEKQVGGQRPSGGDLLSPCRSCCWFSLFSPFLNQEEEACVASLGFASKAANFAHFNICRPLVKRCHGSLFPSRCHMSRTSSKFLRAICLIFAMLLILPPFLQCISKTSR